MATEIEVKAALSKLYETVRCYEKHNLLRETDQETVDYWLELVNRREGELLALLFPSKPKLTKEQQVAQDLFEKGYCCLSNKHRIVARIDREDWLHVLASKQCRAPADFYTRTSQGAVTDCTGQWGKFYASVYSDDKREGIDPVVYAELKSLWNKASDVVTYKGE